jgi:hypothetical protein
MAAITMDIVATLEDGNAITVTADQRDFARFEVQPFGCSFEDIGARMFTALRYFAWSAASRQQLTRMTWQQWQDRCVEALPVLDEDEASEDEGSAAPADANTPGLTGQSG